MNIDIDHDKTDTSKPWSTTSSSNTDILFLIHLYGDDDLQFRLRTLCTEFSDIFSNELPKEPADIIVDNPKWQVSSTQLAVKQIEFLKFHRC